MTNYQSKLNAMMEFVSTSFDSPEDVTTFLEISIEDLINLFPDRLVRMHSRVFVPDVDEQEELNDLEEEEAWDGFSTPEEYGTSENIWDETEEDFE